MMYRGQVDIAEGNVKLVMIAGDFLRGLIGGTAGRCDRRGGTFSRLQR